MLYEIIKLLYAVIKFWEHYSEYNYIIWRIFSTQDLSSGTIIDLIHTMINLWYFTSNTKHRIVRIFGALKKSRITKKNRHHKESDDF